MKCILALLCVGTLLPAQAAIGEVSAIILPQGMQLDEVWHADLSGDGLPDLVLAAIEESGSYARSLRVHYDRGADASVSFVQEPDLVIDLPRTISACAFGDVHPDAGSEVIWFGARGVYIWRQTANPEEAVVKILASEFLYQFPQSETLHSWQDGLRDLNGDGLIDLVLPEPSGFLIAIQRRDPSKGVEFTSSRLQIPDTLPEAQGSSSMRGGRRSRSFDIGMEFSGATKPRAPLVSVAETLPAPQFLDWDADTDLDLIVKREQRVLVWLQDESGRFSAQASHDLGFPLTESQTELDPSYGAWMTDFDGDQRADALLIAKDRNADDLRSQILFFRQDPNSETPLFNGGRPQQLLLLAGLALPPELIDVDGNGFVDLQVGSWRLDALDQLTAGENRSLEGEIYVYLNQKGRYSRRPDLTHKVTLQGEQLSEGNALLFKFFADVNGDGLRDLLIREKAEELKLQLLRRRNKQLSILDRSIWRLQIAEQARIEILQDQSRPGLLVLESDRLLLVRF